MTNLKFFTWFVFLILYVFGLNTEWNYHIKFSIFSDLFPMYTAFCNLYTLIAGTLQHSSCPSSETLNIYPVQSFSWRLFLIKPFFIPSFQILLIFPFFDDFEDYNSSVFLATCSHSFASHACTTKVVAIQSSHLQFL